MRTLGATVLALALAFATAGLAAPAAAYGHDTSEDFVLGGAHAEAAWPPDPAQVLGAEEAAAAATCGPEAVLDPGPGPVVPPEPAASASLGGACLPVPDAAEDRVRVYVDRFVPDAYLPIGVAAGYDADGDGCIGCTDADQLWQGRTSLTLPVQEDHPWVMVFVYALDVDVGNYPAHATAAHGTIAVQPADEEAGCGDQPSIPGAGCEKVPADEMDPHLCVPACQPVVDRPA